jgi:hypothetical protein
MCVVTKVTEDNYKIHKISLAEFLNLFQRSNLPSEYRQLYA